MVYLDNAATSWPKPRETVMEMLNWAVYYGANPGRSGYEMAMSTAEKIYECRRKTADFFGCPKGSEEKVIFTPGCTFSINYVIKGLLKYGDHVVISNLEHNAVLRPLNELSKAGVSYSVAKADYRDDDDIVKSFASAVKRNTRLIICTHASNVTGRILPVEKIGELCKKSGISFAVDCSQMAGVLPVNIQKMNINFMCAPAHKGLYGAPGLGILIINSKRSLKTIIEGGTGSLSSHLEPPDILPDRFESGTVNVPGICALSGGLDYLKGKTVEKIYNHEKSVVSVIYNGIKDIENVEVYSEPDSDKYVPILLFNIKGLSCEQTAHKLDENGIAVRAGLHCAPLAHKAIGTMPDGAVRICPSAFTAKSDADFTVQVITKIARDATKN